MRVTDSCNYYPIVIIIQFIVTIVTIVLLLCCYRHGYRSVTNVFPFISCGIYSPVINADYLTSNSARFSARNGPLSLVNVICIIKEFEKEDAEKLLIHFC